MQAATRMSSGTVLFAAILLATAISACGASLKTATSYPATGDWSLATSRSSTELDALEGDFYARGPFNVQALEVRIDKQLATNPGSARLHEMAALLAELREESDAVIEHYLSAARDLSSPHTLIYLSRAFENDLTVRQTNEAMSLLKALMEKHWDSSVRADARRRLIRLRLRRGELDAAKELAAGQAFVRDMLVAGPFDNDQGKGFDTPFAPELDFDPEAEMPGMRLPVRFRPATVFSHDGQLAVSAQVTPSYEAVAYAATYVHSADTRDAQLRVTTTSALKAWVNGEPVLSEELITRDATDGLVATVSLEAGWNLVLLKSANRTGAWSLGLRFTDVEGGPLNTLSVSSAPHATPTAAPTENRPEQDQPEVDVPMGGREALLKAFAAMRTGHTRDALNSLSKWAQEAGDNPVALLQLALAHAANEEEGRAIDLLNRGVELTEPWGTGFVLERARYALGKDQWDKALNDLKRAKQYNPKGRFTRMELAGTYSHIGWLVDRCNELEEVLDSWPSSDWALRELAECLDARDYTVDATAKHREAYALEPGHPFTLDRLAQLAFMRLDYAEAKMYYARLAELFPEQPLALLRLANLERIDGQRERAREILDGVMAQDPGNPIPFYRLADMAQEDGSLRAAIDFWTDALARNPEDARLVERLDYIDSDQDDGGRRYMPSEDAVQSAVAKAWTVDVMPGAHTVSLIDDEVTVVLQDGSAQRFITAVSLAVTTEGRDQLIAQGIPYDARVLEAYTVNESGERQDAASIRDGEIRFRNLEVGSVVVLQYAWHSASPDFLPNHFVGDWWFQGVHRQAEQARWLIVLPEGRDLTVHTVGPVTHDVGEIDGATVHTLSASRVPPLVAEPFMAPARDLLYQASVSTVPDWDDYVSWERALLREVFESNANIRALAASLSEGASTVQERVDRIFHFVAEEIRYQQDYEDTIAGVRPHTAPMVVERGYGDCKDKAVLFIQLAKELGIQARFAILRTTDAGKVHREVPDQQFNHAIVYLPKQEGVSEGRFLDPTTDGLDIGNLRSDDQGALSLVLDPDNGGYSFIPIPYQGPEFQRFETSMSVQLVDSDTASAEISTTLRGTVAERFRQVLRNDEQASILYQNLTNQFWNGARVKSAEARDHQSIWHPLSLHIDADISGALQTQDKRVRLQIPPILSLDGFTRLESRKTPMRLGVPETVRASLKFELPAGSKIIQQPGRIQTEHPCFSFKQNVRRSGRNLEVDFNYTRTCTDLTPAEYAGFREKAIEVANALKEQLILELR